MSNNQSSNQNPPITLNGKKKLEVELKHLLSVERPAVLEAIEVARGHGDLSENAEYHAAKERQAYISARIDYVKGIIASAQVIDPKSIRVEHVAFGATVEIIDAESGEESVYQIVGQDEADIKKKKISIASPVARAMVGKREGDEIVVRSPKGEIIYEVAASRYE